MKVDFCSLYVIERFGLTLELGIFFTLLFIFNTGPPEQPTDILATCEITLMIVSWQPGSNGGFEQTFKVAWLNTITQRTDYSLEIKDSGQKLIQQYIVRSLYPETMYVIHVEATNKHGIVISTKNVNCTTGLSMFIVLSC